ncbi:carbon-nitrogen hydrolase family protein [Jannaschia seohaensis]|uniref:Predicted amidohydrolase n=1 Tax=Jannaschia seohaensis TaxID=475081 RepID=A0A2Y9B5Y3_9RHOB|nr:carbon-nitrogen hydrolase family protein [Jannaschia seohaensis]PWJ15896.1 putative amidohydrolase [Jannaschia seohaensis]SSA49609.1 Predicted amidohydrolase [Jannaschia seohaensis]
MTDVLRVSMVQTTSHNTHAVNVDELRAAAAFAAEDGATMLAMPEAAGLMDRNKDHARAQITTEDQDPYIAACREEAAARGLWIHSGSCPIKSPDGRYLNHTVLVDPSGEIVARYDKIHLFDVFLEGRPATGESSRYAPGETAVLADTPFGPLGMTICYDLRFPHLYRDYALAGANVLFAPSAFTVPTGRAHWEVLLRARAIETGSYVVAAAQVGNHADGRVTWGHSLIVSPWGEVMADLGGEAPGQITLDLPLNAVESARRQIPNLKNARDYDFLRVPEGANAPTTQQKTPTGAFS